MFARTELETDLKEMMQWNNVLNRVEKKTACDNCHKGSSTDANPLFKCSNSEDLRFCCTWLATSTVSFRRCLSRPHSRRSFSALAVQSIHWKAPPFEHRQMFPFHWKAPPFEHRQMFPLALQIKDQTLQS